MSALVIIEHNNKQLKPANLNAISAANQLSNKCDVLVLGAECDEVVKQASQIDGVTTVLYQDHPSFEHALAETVAPVIASLASEYDAVIAVASTQSKNILPRVAALLDVAKISDVIEVVESDTFIRPIYAGNALETVQSLDPIKVLTVRSTAFEPVQSVGGSAATKALSFITENSVSQWVSSEIVQSERPDLTEARVVISGGRGLQNQENFSLLEQLANKLGAAIGASRAAVDAGYVANEYQVGQTGKVVAPELYIAVGISGAVQHLAGMKDSKIIVAINKDEDAPIFQIASYGLVGDLFEIVPELIEKL